MKNKKWINVSDTLPDAIQFKCVLVCIWNGSYTEHELASYEPNLEGNDVWWIGDREMSCKAGHKVTHWMELPELPEFIS